MKMWSEDRIPRGVIYEATIWLTERFYECINTKDKVLRVKEQMERRPVEQNTPAVRDRSLRSRWLLQT